MNSCVVGIDLGVTSEHVACISDGDGKPSKKTIRFSRRHCKRFSSQMLQLLL